MAHMRSLILRSLLSSAIVGMLLPMQAFPQAPGSAWAHVLTPERTIKTLYWKLFDKTEIWMRIVPEVENGSGTSKIPASLIIWVTYPGKILAAADIKTRPQEIMLQAQPDPLTIVNTLSLFFLVNDKILFDLVANHAHTITFIPAKAALPMRFWHVWILKPFAG
jgi:hypothetical protein